MNRRDNREVKLIVELFHEDWSDGVAAGFASTAAARVRHQRLVRKSVAAAAALLLSAALPYFIFHQRPEISPAVTRPYAPPAGYEIISTQELLNQLRDRPFLVINDGKSQKVILLNNG